MKTERIEAMSDILHELGIEATPMQIEELTEDFSLHLEMEKEISSYAHVGGTDKCDKCESLKSQLKTANECVDVYHNSVMKRNQASRVWLEGDVVMYER